MRSWQEFLEGKWEDWELFQKQMMQMQTPTGVSPHQGSHQNHGNSQQQSMPASNYQNDIKTISKISAYLSTWEARQEISGVLDRLRQLDGN